MKRIRIPLLAALVGTACMTAPRPVAYDPGDYLSANQLSEVWVTTTAGRDMVITGPRVITDTVFGWSQDGQEEVILAVADIRELRARRMDPVRTAMIPVGIAVAAVAVTALVSAEGAPITAIQAECAILEEC